MAPIGMDSEKLTAVQQRAITALLSTRSIAEAAKQARVGLRTLHRWMGESAFRGALSSAEGALIDAATRRLLQHQNDALTTILMIMADKKFPAGVRLRAATSIIESMLKLRELRNVEERLSALEAAYADNK